MILDNDNKNKDEWIKNEKRIRSTIIGVIFAILFLVIIFVFFRTQIWAIITGSAIVVGLIVDLITLLNIKKGG